MSAAAACTASSTKLFTRRPPASALPAAGSSVIAGVQRQAEQFVAQHAAADKTPPTVFAAHLGQENLDLWIAPPDPNPPRPWWGSAKV